MPLLSITARYSKKSLEGVAESETLAFQRKAFKDRFKYGGKLTQTIITHGNPDGHGAIDPETTLAIRTEAQISQEEADRLRKDVK